MELFSTHSNRCYLLYNNYLVFNLSKNELDACIAKLRIGKLYNKSKGYYFRTFLKDLKSGYEEVYNYNNWDCWDAPTLTLIIDDKFNMVFNNKTKQTTLTDARETVNSCFPKFFDWLGEHLIERGFEKYLIKRGKQFIYLKKGIYDAWIQKVK